MLKAKPVEVPRGAFAFCRWSFAVALWAAFLLRQPVAVAVVAAVLAVSAVTGIGRSPLVLLWRGTVHRLWPSRSETVDERGLRFAHALAAVLCSAAVVLLQGFPPAGRGLLVLIAVSKTLGALGFCTAYRLWESLLVRGERSTVPGPPHA
jgi:hypothetical protein